MTRHDHDDTPDRSLFQAACPTMGAAEAEAHAAMRRHAGPLSGAHFDFLESKKINRAARHGLTGHNRTFVDDNIGAANPLFSASILNVGGGRFEFAGVGSDPALRASAIVLLAHGADSRALDVIALLPSDGSVLTYLGLAGVNDEREALRLRMDEELTVHPSPIEWLRADRRGVFVTDIRRASILRDCGPLLCADVEHGRRLREALSYSPPSIMVPAADVARAA